MKIELKLGDGGTIVTTEMSYKEAQAIKEILKIGLAKGSLNASIRHAGDDFVRVMDKIKIG